MVGGRSSCNSGKGKSSQSSVKYGYSLVKGKANHPMEDYHVAKFVQFKGRELGLFAIYDGHLGDSVPAYLQKHLFSNILKEVSCWIKPKICIYYLDLIWFIWKKDFASFLSYTAYSMTIIFLFSTSHTFFLQYQPYKRISHFSFNAFCCNYVYDCEFVIHYPGGLLEWSIHVHF